MLESYKSTKTLDEIKGNYADSERTELIPGLLLKISKSSPEGEADPVKRDDEGNVISVSQGASVSSTPKEEFTVLKLAIPLGETKSLIFADPDLTNIQNLSLNTGSLEKVLDLGGFEFDMSSLGIDKLSTDFNKFTQDIKDKIESFGK